MKNKTYKRKSLDNNKFNDDKNNNLNQKTEYLNLSVGLLSLNNVGKPLNTTYSLNN
jgi:hypothetical protein